MADENLYIKIGVDVNTSEAEDGLNKVEKTVDKVVDKTEDLADKFNEVGEAISDTEGKAEELTDKFDDMGGKAEGSLDKIGKSMTSVVDRTKVAQEAAVELAKAIQDSDNPAKAFDDTLEVLSGTMTKLKESAKELYKKMHNTTDAESADVMLQQYQELNATIDVTAETYDILSRNQKKFLDLLKEPAPQNGNQESVRQQLRALTNEISSLTVQYNAMSEAEQKSAKGRELARKIEELNDKAGKLSDVMDDVNRQIKGLASDTAGLDALGEGLNIAASGAGGLVGAMQMLGVAEEDVQNIQTQLQASLAISNALTVAQNNLQKQSALMLGISSVQRYAEAKAIAYSRLIKIQDTNATIGATLAQKAFNVVAKANPYVLLATALATVVGALWAFANKTSEATKLQKQQEEETQKQIELQKEFEKSISQSAGTAIAKYRLLADEYKKLTNEHQRTEWIEKNKGAFNELGLSVGNVTDAERVFIQDTNKIIQSFKLRAEAAAYQQKLQDAYARKIERESQLEKTGNFRLNPPVKGGRVFDTTGLVKGQDYAWDSEKLANVYTEIGAAKAAKDKVLVEIDKEINDYADKVSTLSEKATELIPKSTAKAVSNTAKSNKAEIEKAAKEYAEAVAKLEKDAAQADVDAQKDGEKKTLEQIKLNYENRKAEIAKQEKELLEKKKSAGYGEGLSEREKSYFASLNKANEFTFTNESNNVKNARLEAEKQSQQEYLELYGSYQQKRLAITQKYAKLIEDAANDWDKEKYKKQAEEALSELNFDEFQRKINWSGVFGDLTSKTKSELASLKNVVSDAIKSGKFDKDIEKLQILYEKLSDIDEQLIAKNGAFDGFGLALNELKDSQKQLNDAEKALTEARITGDDATIKAAEDELVLAQQRNNMAKESVRIAKKSTAEFLGNMRSFFESIGNAASGGSWSGIFSGFGKIAPTIDGLLGSNISDAFNALGDEMVGEIDNIITNVASIIQDITSPKSISEQEKTNIYLSNICDYLDRVIEEINDDKKTVAESIESYNKAITQAKEADASAMKNLAVAWTDSKTGHNSFNYKVNQSEFGSIDWEIVSGYINNILGKTGTYHSLFDLADNLSTSELKEVLDAIPQIQTAIDNYYAHLTSGNTYHVSNAKSLANSEKEALDIALSLANKVEDAEKALENAIINVSFEDIKNEFHDTLSSMTNDTEDFADNVEESLRKAVINGLMKDNYNKLLSEWYNDLKDAIANDGHLDVDEASKLRNSYHAYAEQAMAQRNAIFEALGLDNTTSKISATQRSVASMSEDTASELNGRFTALQISGNSIDKNLQTLARDVQSNAKETHRLLNKMVEGTDDIADNTGQQQEVKARLEVGKLEADVDTSALQGSIDGLASAVKGIQTPQVNVDAPEVNVDVPTPQVNVEQDTDLLQNVIQQVNSALMSLAGGNAQNLSMLTSINSSMGDAVSAINSVQSSIMESNSLLASINMSVLACNGTLNAIYNTNDAGFRSLQGKLDSVVSAINSKM